MTTQLTEVLYLDGPGVVWTLAGTLLWAVAGIGLRAVMASLTDRPLTPETFDVGFDLALSAFGITVGEALKVSYLTGNRVSSGYWAAHESTGHVLFIWFGFQVLFLLTAVVSVRRILVGRPREVLSRAAGPERARTRCSAWRAVVAGALYGVLVLWASVFVVTRVNQWEALHARDKYTVPGP